MRPAIDKPYAHRIVFDVLKTAGDVRMPYACPACLKVLYSTSGSRPGPCLTRRARALYAVAGTLATLIYFAGGVALREALKRPIGPVLGNRHVILYRMPPTWVVSLMALPVALIPGLALGWVASRLPHVRRLHCWNCGWSATYPENAVWSEARAQSTQASTGFDVLADDVDPWKECSAWAYAEIRRGRLPEEVEADLVAQGWPSDEVAGMVEKSRKEARARRV